MAAEPDLVPPADPAGPGLGHAVEQLVVALPPKERACVLLKDVFDYSRDEIAKLVDSTVGGVKAALSRGRSKLAALPAAERPSSAIDPGEAHLLGLYIERFNRRDWDGLRELISADARLLVPDRFAGRLADAPYFGRYARLAAPPRLALALVDGSLAIVAHRDGPDGADGPTPAFVIRVDVRDCRITRIADYTHCPWVLTDASLAPVSSGVREP